MSQRTAAIALSLLLLALISYAQGTRAGLTGVITDPNGASIPDASVSITRVETHETAQSITSGTGTYVFPSLEPGSYKLSVTAPGFKKYEQAGIILQVEQRSRIDVRMEIGSVEQTVEVVAQAPLTQTETSSLGQVVEQKRIVELPLNGRNPLELMRLSTGVNLLATAFLDTRNFNLTSVSINGGQGGTSSVMVDGAAVNLPGRNEYAVAPNVDAVEEFKVQTNSYSAEYGLTGGGAITMVTRSGTNQWRGSLFEFLRNDKLDATGWTNNSRGLRKQPIRYNQFGGSLGGPVRVPKVYDGTDRTWFFFAYEGIRYRSTTTNLVRVPTELERRGDFSQTFIVNNNRQIIPVQIFDPFSTRPNPSGSGLVRTPIAGARLSANQLDPVAVRALQYIPLPNRTPDDATGANNYVSTPSLFSNTDQFNVRIDHQLTSTHRFSGRYTHSDAENTGLAPTFAQDNPADPNASTQGRYNKNFVASLTSTLTPTLLNEFRASITRQYLRSVPSSYEHPDNAQLGLPALIPPAMFPRYNISDVTSIGSTFSQLRLAGQTVPQVMNSLTLIRGKHQLKVGGEWRNFLFNNFQPGAISGQFTFNRTLTGDPQAPQNTGFGFATFLTGAVGSGNLVSATGPAVSRHYLAGFVQDDWKVSRTLTLNLGLRYDLLGNPVERYNRFSTFVPEVQNSVTGTVGAVGFAGVNGVERGIWAVQKNNWGPRVGFAWNVFGNSTTVIRGGYGLFYYHGGAPEFPAQDGFASNTQFQSTLGTQYSAFTLQRGPDRLDPIVGSAGGDATFLGNNVSMVERNSPISSAQQWNFGIQRMLPAQILLDVAYAGNRTAHAMSFNWDLNQLDPQYLSLGLRLDEAVPNPFFGVIPSGPLSGRTITRQQSLRPYPAYQGINVISPRLGSSTYHSMQMRVEKRYSSGFTLLASYTFSKLIGDIGRNIIDFASTGGAPQGSVGCGQNTKYDRRSCRSIEPQDVTHYLVLSSLYELPFGKGKAFASGGGLSNLLVGGWQINGVFTARTGLPIVVRGANNRAADRPNVVGDPTLDSGQRLIDRWFNTAAFAAPPLFTFGDAPRTLPDTRGPSFRSLDLSVFKNIPVTERVRIQLRLEAFNALNRTNFDQPNANFLASQFGAITTAGEPRTLQIALKLLF